MEMRLPNRREAHRTDRYGAYAKTRATAVIGLGVFENATTLRYATSQTSTPNRTAKFATLTNS